MFSIQQQLFKSSNFGPVDILASTGICGVSSLYAATHPSYRVSFNNSSDVGFAEDVRFVLGSTSLLYSQLYAPEYLRRPLTDLSLGLLTSFFGTEIVRQRSIERTRAVEEIISEGNIIEEEDLGSPSFNAWTPDENPKDNPLSYSFGF